MSYRSVLNASNGGPSNPKLTLKINSLRIKRKAQNFASCMLSEYAFKIGRKKRKWFFDHSTTLMHSRRNLEKSYITLVFSHINGNEEHTVFIWLTIVCVEPKTVLHGTRKQKKINVSNELGTILCLSINSLSKSVIHCNF